MGNYEKRGYLDSAFRLFHLTDTDLEEMDYHYHEFDKIMIFMKGHVTYMIEGTSYELKPYDIVLVNHNDIHKPLVDTSVPYERMIVYVSPGFITHYVSDSYNLNFCFEQAQKEHSHVLRAHGGDRHPLLKISKELESSFLDTGYACELQRQLLFLQFMIQLNRAALSDSLEYLNTTSGNDKILQIMTYINGHLTEELSMERLAALFYISKFHMMRLFKEETGLTIGKYITQKRLLLAKDKILEGVPITQVCFDCGFRDYSAFSRAYKGLFGISPKQTLMRK